MLVSLFFSSSFSFVQKNDSESKRVSVELKLDIYVI